jgi:hypothetical protein
MAPNPQQSGARSSSVPFTEDGRIESEPARDEYPIRHAWTFVIPPAPADRFAARDRLSD